MGQGLSPMMVEQIGRLLEEIARRGVAIVLIEQKLTIALKISHWLYVMGHGKRPARPVPVAGAA
jgi:branched-chain amino acid transport system ATP-binding protein